MAVALSLCRPRRSLSRCGRQGRFGGARTRGAGAVRAWRRDLSACDGPPEPCVAWSRVSGQRSMYTDRGANSPLERVACDEQSDGARSSIVHVSGYLVLDPRLRRRHVGTRARSPPRSHDVDRRLFRSAPLPSTHAVVFSRRENGATSFFANSEEALVLSGSRRSPRGAGFPRRTLPRGDGDPRSRSARSSPRTPCESTRPRGLDVVALDTTGAGDAATGAYLAARLSGDSISKTSLAAAMDDAARVVQDLGAN